MNEKIKFEDKEYDAENFNEQAKAAILSLQFVTARIKELNNMQSILNRARASYIEAIKTEMLSVKAGIILGDN
jgi:hypothetical protein